MDLEVGICAADEYSRRRQVVQYGVGAAGEPTGKICYSRRRQLVDLGVGICTAGETTGKTMLFKNKISSGVWSMDLHCR